MTNFNSIADEKYGPDSQEGGMWEQERKSDKVPKYKGFIPVTPEMFVAIKAAFKVYQANPTQENLPKISLASYGFRSYEKKTGGMAEMIQCKPQVLLTDDTRAIIREWGAQQGGQQAQPAPYVAPPTQQPAPPPVQQPAPAAPQQAPVEPFSSSFEQLFD